MRGDRPEELFFLAVFLIAHYIVGLMIKTPRRRLPLYWVLVAGLAAPLERKLNRDRRSAATRIIRGGLLLVVVVTSALAIAQGISLADRNLGAVLSFFIFASTISVMSPLQNLRAVERALKGEHPKKAAHILAPFIKADLDGADGHAVARKAIEYAGWSLNRLLVAPLFWFCVFGVGGLLTYTGVAAVDRVIGLQTERYKYFGFAAARMDTVLNFIPARLTGIIIGLAAFIVPHAKPLQSFRTLRRQARKNASWPMAALAGALGVTLGGKERGKSGDVRESPWIGAVESSAKVNYMDIYRVVGLHTVSFILVLILITIMSAVLFYISKFYPV